MCEWGYEEGRGQEALARINWAHGHYKIGNDDFLYVLSTFIFDPIRWMDSFCWRKLSENERQAYYYFWRGVGTRMGMRDMSLDAFAAWAAAYEREHLRFADSNSKIGS